MKIFRRSFADTSSERYAWNNTIFIGDTVPKSFTEKARALLKNEPRAGISETPYTFVYVGTGSAAALKMPFPIGTFAFLQKSQDHGNNRGVPVMRHEKPVTQRQNVTRSNKRFFREGIDGSFNRQCQDLPQVADY